jgi:hypothetical protein
MTCPRCGMTICWDCVCDPELNALIAEAQALCQRCGTYTGNTATQELNGTRVCDLCAERFTTWRCSTCGHENLRALQECANAYCASHDTR